MFPILYVKNQHVFSLEHIHYTGCANSSEKNGNKDRYFGIDKSCGEIQWKFKQLGIPKSRMIKSFLNKNNNLM